MRAELRAPDGNTAYITTGNPKLLSMWLDEWLSQMVTPSPAYPPIQLYIYPSMDIRGNTDWPSKRPQAYSQDSTTKLAEFLRELFQ